MSILGNVVTDDAQGQGGSGGVMPDQDTSAAFQQGGTGQPVQVGITQAAPAPAQQPTAPATPQAPSRLQKILGAVASVATTGLSGIPDRGRPGFVQGLGQGARAEQAAQAQQQAIKFKTFEDSVRASQLHNEDVRMQWASEDHQNAVQANADAQAKRMTDTTGMTYTFVPNDDGGKAALDHMGVQMAQNGSVSVPAGTISGPKGWYIPNQSSAEQAQALTADFNARAPFYGFNPVPKGSVVNGLAYDQLRQASNGLDSQGHPMSPTDWISGAHLRTNSQTFSLQSLVMTRLPALSRRTGSLRMSLALTAPSINQDLATSRLESGASRSQDFLRLQKPPHVWPTARRSRTSLPLVDKYFRMMSSIPEYQKAATGIARTNTSASLGSNLGQWVGGYKRISDGGQYMSQCGASQVRVGNAPRWTLHLVGITLWIVWSLFEQQSIRSLPD